MYNKNEKEAYHSLESAIQAAFGETIYIIEEKRIYGGDINDASALLLSNGQKIFMKSNTSQRYCFFETEKRGLEALRSTQAIGIPKLLGTGVDQKRGIAFLLLEYIESASPIKTYWETFGRQLAAMHRADCKRQLERMGKNIRFGFLEDNFIGATPQKNTPKENWIDFYRECRLLPQIKMAEHELGSELRKQLDNLLNNLDHYLREPEFPSIVHGDLWSGNVLGGPDGKAWILDPAAYVGDFETDLAMTELFGRFPQRFYDAYHEVNPIEKGYTQRKKLYQLYHLLNHLNLFGRSYLRSVAAIVREYQ